MDQISTHTEPGRHTSAAGAKRTGAGGRGRALPRFSIGQTELPKLPPFASHWEFLASVSWAAAHIGGLGGPLLAHTPPPTPGVPTPPRLM